MLTRFQIEFVPPSGDDEAEPFQLEVEEPRPVIRLPDVGDRFAFVDPWGRRQSGTVTAREDKGFAEDGAPETRLIALTIAAAP